MGSSDRRPYRSEMTLDQAFLDQMASNLEFQLEMVTDIERPGGTIRASDRNKYVGSTFYEAIASFPVIKRTIGEWLSPTIEFSRLEIPLSNVDGRFNSFLPGGANYSNFIGKEVQVRLGLRDQASTYTTIYRGRVTDVGGFQRDRSRIKVIARDDLDKTNVKFPKTGLTQTSYADLEDGLVGTLLPVIYGDWTASPLQQSPGANPGDPPIETASVPAFPVNGKAPGVIAGTDPVLLIVSENDNTLFDAGNVWLRRGDDFFQVAAADITVGAGNRTFEIEQNGATLVDSGPFVYTEGDLFFVRVKGKDLGAYDDNLVWQARDILVTQGLVDTADFAASWATYRDKASPAESAVANMKSRVWVQDQEDVVTYVLSMLEQVRLEMFINRDLKFALSALHLDAFDATPGFTVRQWDLQESGFEPKLDERNVWNRGRGDYAYDPALKANALVTPTFRVQDAIDQWGKEIAKKAVFPNLYVESDVVLNLKEMLRLATGSAEFIDMVLTPRAALLDIGDFVAVDLEMGSVAFEGVPAMIREIGYDPSGLRIPVKVWSFQMIPFPGWTPGYAGTVGGSAATITQET